MPKELHVPRQAQLAVVEVVEAAGPRQRAAPILLTVLVSEEARRRAAPLPAAADAQWA